MLSLIVAKGKNNEIGKDNKLLWDLPEDMKNFQKLTNGKTVIMGRKTHESIGRLLPNRLNVVVSSTMEDPNIKNLVIFRSLEDVYFHYQRYAGEIFVLGGSSIYEYFKDSDNDKTTIAYYISYRDIDNKIKKVKCNATSKDDALKILNDKRAELTKDRNEIKKDASLLNRKIMNNNLTLEDVAKLYFPTKIAASISSVLS